MSDDDRQIVHADIALPGDVDKQTVKDTMHELRLVGRELVEKEDAEYDVHTMWEGTSIRYSDRPLEERDRDD